MKRFLSTVLASALVLSTASLSTFAASVSSSGVVNMTGVTSVYDEDGDDISWSVSGGSPSISDGSITLDGVNPNQTIYIPLGADTNLDDVTTLSDGGTAAAIDLGDDDLFKITTDKDGTGKSLIKSVTQVSNKKLGGLDRGSYLKIVLGDSTTTSELKATVDVTFKAKKDMDSSTSSLTPNSGSGFGWVSSETAELSIHFWINNTKITGTDGDADTGDSVYFSPEDNENNTLVWGDDRAALYFTSDDDASDFYAKLSTKSDSDIYSEYGDPVNADLWFFDFVGNPTIPSTSRATLTLGIPWDEDEDYAPNPEDCYVYEVDSDGYLTDVTTQFTYDEDNDSTTGIAGWTIKTRTLGTYVISDTELDVTSYDDVDEEISDDSEESEEAAVDTGKEIPNTGSSDMVGVAVVAAVVSLAAAGAIAFKKAAK